MQSLPGLKYFAQICLRLVIPRTLFMQNLDNILTLLNPLLLLDMLLLEESDLGVQEFDHALYPLRGKRCAVDVRADWA